MEEIHEVEEEEQSVNDHNDNFDGVFENLNEKEDDLSEKTRML